MAERPHTSSNILRFYGPFILLRNKLITFFPREKTAGCAYSFWFLKIRFRQTLAVAARGSTASSSLISVSGGCCGRKAGVCMAVPGLN